jgi:hypothetical protein
MRDEVVRDREAHEQGRRLTWEHEDDYDPLLGEIAAARNAMLAADAAADRVRPGVYSAPLLPARGPGLRRRHVHLRIRTAFDDAEVTEVARLTSARAARRPAEAP